MAFNESMYVVYTMSVLAATHAPLLFRAKMHRQGAIAGQASVKLLFHQLFASVTFKIPNKPGNLLNTGEANPVRIHAETLRCFQHQQTPCRLSAATHRLRPCRIDVITSSSRARFRANFSITSPPCRHLGDIASFLGLPLRVGARGLHFVSVTSPLRRHEALRGEPDIGWNRADFCQIIFADTFCFSDF